MIISFYLKFGHYTAYYYFRKITFIIYQKYQLRKAKFSRLQTMIQSLGQIANVANYMLGRKCSILSLKQTVVSVSFLVHQKKVVNRILINYPVLNSIRTQNEYEQHSNDSRGKKYTRLIDKLENFACIFCFQAAFRITQQYFVVFTYSSLATALIADPPHAKKKKKKKNDKNNK